MKASGLCEPPVHGDGGLAEARVVAAGEPWRSVLLARIATRDVTGMPPVGSLVVHEDAVARVEAWIEELASCP